MKNQQGFSLSEVLISLFLASLIMGALTSFYLSSKHQYLQADKILSSHLELQWVSDLLGDSIRRAGFTPCVGLNHLEIIDRRGGGHHPQAFYMENQPQQLMQINRMSEHFSTIQQINSATQLSISRTSSLHKQRPVIIADCQHAEIQKIIAIDSFGNELFITLEKPLLFSYSRSAYIGEFIEERWFIKNNPKGKRALYYHQVQTEELSSSIHSLQVEKQDNLVKVMLGIAADKKQELVVAIRGL